MSLIRSLEALKQPLDFTRFSRYCKDMSDIDSMLRLTNENRILLEVKKETNNHTVDKIINSNQWQILRELANNRSNYYLLYVTHNQIINANQAIDLAECKVKYLENCGISLDVSDFEDTLSCIHYLAFKKLEEKYYIVIKYKNGEMKYAIRKPVAKKWYLDNYVSISCDFNSYDEAYKYIQTRYKKYINVENQYLLFRKNTKIDVLEKTFTFEDFKYMF